MPFSNVLRHWRSFPPLTKMKRWRRETLSPPPSLPTFPHGSFWAQNVVISPPPPPSSLGVLKSGTRFCSLPNSTGPTRPLDIIADDFQVLLPMRQLPFAGSLPQEGKGDELFVFSPSFTALRFSSGVFLTCLAKWATPTPFAARESIPLLLLFFPGFSPGIIAWLTPLFFTFSYQVRSFSFRAEAGTKRLPAALSISHPLTRLIFLPITM